MSEATVVIDKVFTKEGEKNGKTWKRWDIKDKNENRYSTFNETQGQLAENGIDKRFKLTYEESQYGNTLKEIAGPVEDEEPKLGDGSYVKGQTAPSDKRSITASVALRHACVAVAHTIPSDATAKQASEKVLPLANAFFLWLSEKSGLPLADDSEVPFG